METLLLDALDKGGVLVLAILMFLRFNQRFDTIIEKLDQLVKITILGFDEKDKETQAKNIINGN